MLYHCFTKALEYHSLPTLWTGVKAKTTHEQNRTLVPKERDFQGMPGHMEDPMFGVESSGTNIDGETQISVSTKQPLIPKAVLIAGSAVVIFIFILLTVVFLPKDDVPLPITTWPQQFQQIEPAVMEPGSASVLTNNSFLFSNISLVKTHQRGSILILTGGLTLIIVAITLGVIFGRPSETIVDQLEVKEFINNEKELDQNGEESFWNRIMWSIIVCGIGVTAVIIVRLFIVKQKKIIGPTSFAASKTDTTIKLAIKEQLMNVGLFKLLKSQIKELRILLPKDKVHFFEEKIPSCRPYNNEDVVYVDWPSKVGETNLFGNIVLCNLYRLRDRKDYGLILATTSKDPKSFVFDISEEEDACYSYVDLDTDLVNIHELAIWGALKRLCTLFNEQIISYSGSKSPINRGLRRE
jgi:hypothetical protein